MFSIEIRRRDREKPPTNFHASRRPLYRRCVRMRSHCRSLQFRTFRLGKPRPSSPMWFSLLPVIGGRTAIQTFFCQSPRDYRPFRITPAKSLFRFSLAFLLRSPLDSPSAFSWPAPLNSYRPSGVFPSFSIQKHRNQWHARFTLLLSWLSFE